MSGSDYNLFWTETIRQLMADGDLSEQEHDMWFRNMEFIKGDNESITLAVPSNFYRDQVKQRYLDMLISRLHSLTGSSLEINFEIKSSKQAVSEKRSISLKLKRKPVFQPYPGILKENPIVSSDGIMILTDLSSATTTPLPPAPLRPSVPTPAEPTIHS